MYALVRDSPYEAELPLAYFETEIEAQAAMHFIYDYDERKYPDLPRTDWDWGYYVKEVTPTVLAEFKAQYEIKETPNEEASYGGDNCFIGRGVYTGEPSSSWESNGYVSPDPDRQSLTGEQPFSNMRTY